MSNEVETQGRVVDEQERKEIEAMAAKAGSVQMVPVANIERSEDALRDVQRNTEEYQLLMNSIRDRGVLNSILVRRLPDVAGVEKYALVDGLQRWSCAQDVGLSTIPARIVEIDDAEVLEAQLITNLNRVATKASDQSKALLRILYRNPLMTKEELARRVSQSRTWVDKRLGLLKLKPEILALVDDGQINMNNAVALSHIPEEEQPDHVDSAITEAPKTFVPRMKARAKEIKDAKNAGRDTATHEWQPSLYCQKVGDLKAEYEAIREQPASSQVLALLERENISDPRKAAELAIAWTLHADPVSVQEQREKEEKRKALLAEKREQLKKEREAKKAEQAAETAAALDAGW